MTEQAPEPCPQERQIYAPHGLQVTSVSCPLFCTQWISLTCHSWSTACHRGLTSVQCVFSFWIRRLMRFYSVEETPKRFQSHHENNQSLVVYIKPVFFTLSLSKKDLRKALDYQVIGHKARYGRKVYQL